MRRMTQTDGGAEDDTADGVTANGVTAEDDTADGVTAEGDTAEGVTADGVTVEVDTGEIGRDGAMARTEPVDMAEELLLLLP